MALAPNRLYRAHVENLRAVTVGLKRVERELRSAISRQDHQTASALLKILLLLTGSWAECRLRKLLYEVNGFNNNERQYILSGNSQLDYWLRSLETGFRRRYGVPNAALPGSLSPSKRMIYCELEATIESDLRPIIEMRNTLAHGQWARPLNSSCDAIAEPMIVALNNENALSARFKSTILECLAQIVHDLVSGNHAFERDFDCHYGRLENAKRNLQNRDYGSWEVNMIAKFENGKLLREAPVETATASTRTSVNATKSNGIWARILSLLK